MQHYSELPDIKRVIVNTHAIEPQVDILSNYIKLVPLTCSTVTKIVFSFLLVTCRVFRHSFTRMGIGVYERSFIGQFKRQPSDNCTGIHSFFFLHIVMLKNITGDLTEAN